MSDLIINLLFLVWFIYLLIKQYKSFKNSCTDKELLLILGGASMGLCFHISLDYFNDVLSSIINLLN